MGLYEIATEWTGYSYVRMYAWAENPEQAKLMAIESAAKDYKKRKFDPSRWEIRLLFIGHGGAFCTAPDDEGWPAGVGHKVE